mgnify:FL=1
MVNGVWMEGKGVCFFIHKWRKWFSTDFLRFCTDWHKWGVFQVMIMDDRIFGSATPLSERWRRRGSGSRPDFCWSSEASIMGKSWSGATNIGNDGSITAWQWSFTQTEWSITQTEWLLSQWVWLISQLVWLISQLVWLISQLVWLKS